MKRNIKKFALYSALVVVIPGLLSWLIGKPLSLIALVNSSMPALNMALGVIELTIWLIVADYIVGMLPGVKRMELN